MLGTLTVLEAAAACGVESFVNISTDKAADPVSVLGYSKRIAERLTAHMAGQADGTYLSVRFGNVLGSRGSVLDRALSAQVEAGGPLTVTHPEVTRYFMTADEAVQLVLQAAVIGRDGEVLVLDMGEPVRIADIARRLAASAPQPGRHRLHRAAAGREADRGPARRRARPDELPSHPLIRHAPVSPLSPTSVGSACDAGLPAAGRRARRRLARCAASGRPLRPPG